MPMRKSNTRTFHRRLYGGQLQRLTLLKRDDDLRQGTVRALQLFQTRRGAITKTGQTLQHDMVTNQRCTWQLPRTELDRVGVAYINPLDRFVDPVEGGTWQPESTTSISVKLFGNWVSVDCLRIDPPAAS
jgi:hypothetical protein